MNWWCHPSLSFLSLSEGVTADGSERHKPAIQIAGYQPYWLEGQATGRTTSQESPDANGGNVAPLNVRAPSEQEVPQPVSQHHLKHDTVNDETPTQTWPVSMGNGSELVEDDDKEFYPQLTFLTTTTSQSDFGRV